MADITKITQPLIPREIPGKARPLSEQMSELNKTQRVGGLEDQNKILDHEANKSLRDMLGRSAMAPLLRGSADIVSQLQKLVSVMQFGLSTAESANAEPMKQLLSALFIGGDELPGSLLEQDSTSSLFKGEAFDALRAIAAKFEGNQAVKGAIANVLKTFEFNVNLDSSAKTILYQCENLLDYMFSKDRAQFAPYLDSLADMLMQEAQSAKKEAQLPAQEKTAEGQGAKSLMPPYSGSELAIDPKEAAGVLKSNLLPLLGEIVVKYYQSESIRDIVMVVVHNIVRVDKGTPEALKDSIDNLADILNRVASLAENFGKNLFDALTRAAEKAKQSENSMLQRLSGAISGALHNPDSSPAALRQAENMLIGMLQNQSSVMNLLHYILPLELKDEHIYAEMYIDPDNEEAKGRPGEKGHKIFLSVESENHGPMELCFLENNNRIEFSMWCANDLKDTVSGMKKPIQTLMLAHGYTLTGFSVEELTKHHSIIQIFPKLLEKKVGIDVRI
jgi:hypothetical protein